MASWESAVTGDVNNRAQNKDLAMLSQVGDLNEVLTALCSGKSKANCPFN